MYEESIKKETNVVKMLIVSSVIGTVIAALLMLCFAAIIVIFQIERTYAAPLATLSAALGSMASSFYCGRKVGKNGYAIGFANGIAVFLLILLISLIVSDWKFTLNTIFHLVIILTASTAGGIIGVNKNRGKKYI